MNQQTSYSSAHPRSRHGLGRWIYLAIVLLVGASLATVSQAQPPHGRGHHGKDFGAKAGHGPGHLLLSVDENGDGVISAAEFQSFLATADANGDGVLTHEELMAWRQSRADAAGIEMPKPGRRHDRMREHIMERLDTNDDGLLQTSELAAHFAELDADGDGNLSGEELSKHRRQGRNHHRMAIAMALRGADTNQDGQVTAAEWSAFIDSADADGDGQLTFEEVHRRANPDFEPPSLSLEEANEIFHSLDANGDGTISEDELPERRRDRRGPRGPRGGN